jgi:hypothetical protein
MESRTFSGDGRDAIIRAVNDWLAGEKDVAVRRTETHEAQPGLVTFTVWYEREAQ